MMITWLKSDGSEWIWRDGQWIERPAWNWDEHEFVNMAGIAHGDESWPPKELPSLESN